MRGGVSGIVNEVECRIEHSKPKFACRPVIPLGAGNLWAYCTLRHIFLGLGRYGMVALTVELSSIKDLGLAYLTDILNDMLQEEV